MPNLVSYLTDLTTPENFVIVPGVGTLLNTSGAESYALDNGETIGGDYAITVKAGSVSGSDLILKPRHESPSHYLNTSLYEIAVVMGSAYEDTIVPGARLKLAASGILDTWTTTVRMGDYQGIFDAGITTDAGVRRAAKNVVARVLLGCQAVVYPVPTLVETAGTGGLMRVQAYSTACVEKVTSGTTAGYVWAFSGYSSGPNTIDALVDGVALNVNDLSTTPATAQTTAGLSRDGREYEITGGLSGALNGIRFKVNSNAANGDGCHVLIHKDSYLKIAPDVAGVAGTYVDPGTAITLTDPSQGTAGRIPASGASYYWRKLVVPGTASSQRNPVPWRVTFISRDTGVAVWGR